MNRPKALRLGLSSIAVIIAAVAAFVPAFASGDVSSTATAYYGPTGATTASPVPGSATDFQIDQTFTYSGIDEDLKKWIVDSPAGLVGNPNAVAVDDRCTFAEFDPSNTWDLAGAASYPAQRQSGTCPASSRVGFATLYTASDGKDAFGATMPSGAPPEGPSSTVYPPANAPLTPSNGTIYILQSGQDVPTILGTIITLTVYQSPVCTAIYGTPTAAPCQIYRRTTSTLAPETNLSPNNNGDTDFRIRTIPNEDATPPVAYGPTAYTGSVSFPAYNKGGLLAHITRIDQHLFAYPNQDSSQPRFLTMPSRLDGWDSYSYSTAYNTNSLANLVMDPNNTGQLYTKSAASTTTPAQTPPPLKAAGTAVLSSGARDSNPGLAVTISDATPMGDDNAKKIVTTLPPAVSADVDALNNVCSIADRDANNCPSASKVGTASIATPLISAGLTGTVYITKSPNASLPYLSIFVDGAVKFRLDATTRFVGPAFNEIETTFDSLPQTPFTNFVVNIEGGKSNSLLYNRACPTDGSAPPSGPTTFNISGYSGQASSSTSSNTFDGCYGINNPVKSNNCKKQSKKYAFRPSGIIDRPGVDKVQLLTGTKTSNQNKRASSTKSPFLFNLTLKKSKFKKDTKYYYSYKVWYKDGKVIKSKAATFKTCK